MAIFSVSFLLSAQPLSAKENKVFSDQRPILLDSSNYTEYWDQYFLFDDGTLLSSQLIIRNYPFMKHKSFMQSSLVLPNGKKHIIQNGRSSGNWSSDKSRFDIRMFDDIDHQISGKFPDFKLKLQNTTATIKLNMKADIDPIRLTDLILAKEGQISSSLFAPHMTVNGQWRAGTDGEWITLPQGQAFGMHVLIDGPIEKLSKNWIRIFAMPKADASNQNKVILSSILSADDKRSTDIYLFTGGKKIAGFRNIKIKLGKMVKSSLGESPKSLMISAQNDTGRLTGKVTFTKKIEDFRINDHLSALERLISRIFPELHRFRSHIHYDLTYQTESETVEFLGEGFGEYTKIIPPASSKKKRRKKR